jgi:hypothetical protein
LPGRFARYSTPFYEEEGGTMQRKSPTDKTLALLAILLPASGALAVEQENFVVRNAKDLIEVCTKLLFSRLRWRAAPTCRPPSTGIMGNATAAAGFMSVRLSMGAYRMPLMASQLSDEHQ